MKLLDQLKLASRSLKQSKLRTFLTALAIAIGALTINLAMAASNGANGYINKIIKSNFNPSELIVYKEKPQIGGIETIGPQKYNPDSTDSSTRGPSIVQLTNDDIAKLKSYPDIEALRIYYQLSPQYIYSDQNPDLKYSASVQGLDPYFEPDLVAGSIKDLNQDSVILPDSYIPLLNLNDANSAIGKNISLAFSKPLVLNSLPELKIYTFKVAGVVKSQGSTSNRPNITYISNDAAATINEYLTGGTNNEGKYLAVSASIKNYNQKAEYVDQDCLKQTGKDDKACTKQGTQLDSVKVKLNQNGFFAQTPTESISFITQFIGILQMVVVGFGAITVLASIFGIINTQYISVLERTKEIGLMKALGMRSINVMNMFELEAGLIGLIGGGIGAVLAYLISIVANPLIQKSLGIDIDLIKFNPSQAAILALILVLVAIVSGVLPARKAAKLDPIEALRTE